MADPFEFAEGMVKQVLTLATGGIGGIIALFDDDKTSGIQLAGSPLLFWAIGLLAFSAVAGILSLGALTSELAQNTRPANANAANVRYPAAVQMLAFAAGVVLLAVEVLRLHWGWAVAVLLLGAGLAMLAARKPKPAKKADKQMQP